MEETKDIKDKTWAIFAIILLLFLIFEFKGLTNIDPGDEFVYIYMGKLISEGKTPYQDFFHAHPPLKVLVISLIYKLFSFKLFLFKLIPLISILITSFFLFKHMEKRFGKSEAFITLILFLFSMDVLKYSTYILGVCMTAMFVVTAIYYLYDKKYIISGCLFGFAGITGLYSLPIALIAIAIILLNNRKNFFKLIIGFLAIFGIGNLIFLLLYGSSYWNSVYMYHLMKTAVKGNNFAIFSSIIKSNWLLFITPFLLVFCKDKKRISSILLMAFFYLIFLAFLSRIFKIYFMLLFPLLAILGGYSIINVVKRYRQFSENRNIILGIFILLVITVGASNIIKLNKVYFAPFDAGYEMAEYIKENSKSGDLIFGDDSTASLLALLSDRRLASDIADTNEMVFTSGAVDTVSTIEDLKKENIKFMIFRPFGGIFTIQEFKDFMEQNCDVINQYKDQYFGDFFLMDCKPATPKPL